MMLDFQRKIIHCDCDCFYAAVEMRDDPSLRGLPVAIGGAPSKRGVIATCNYPAREQGIHSAMSSAHARRQCSGLIILPPNFDKYREVSRKMREIFFDYTDLVEPLSLDEAYLDVSDSDKCRGSATLMARQIRQRVKDELGITVSTGVAPNKFLAKVGSDWNKPDGETLILPADIDAFVAALPVKKIFGVGKVTAEKLYRFGAQTCGELREFSVFELTQHFGRFGGRLYELCRGIDQRPVKPSQRRKSLSVEHTYPQDLPELDSCLKQLPELLIKLRSRLRLVDNQYLITKQFVKMKFNDFQATTVECLSRQPEDALFCELMATAFERGNLPVRLLGVGVRFVDLLEEGSPEQLELFEAP
jgi:DNA polymerase IV